LSPECLTPNFSDTLEESTFQNKFREKKWEDMVFDVCISVTSRPFFLGQVVRAFTCLRDIPTWVMVFVRVIL
jgi:hypothetical protein